MSESDHLNNGKLYSVVELQKALFSKGHSISLDDLYSVLKETGWIKLFLIRERLLQLKKELPKHTPFDGIRNLIKYPLQVPRDQDSVLVGHIRNKGASHVSHLSRRPF